MLDRVDTSHLFRPLASELVGLLESLTSAEWTKSTSAGSWLVRDVVAHLLDGDLRRLSVQRDGHAHAPPKGGVLGYAELVAYLNQLNAEWATASRRLSPRVLTQLLRLVSTELADHVEGTNPEDEAIFPVAWAGQNRSPMWLDLGREFTERWHHQDQIREAVGQSPLSGPEWLRPVIEVSLNAVPASYGASGVKRDAVVNLVVEGASGGQWYIQYNEEWEVCRGSEFDSACNICLSDLTLARLLLHRIRSEDLANEVRIEGARELAAPLLNARAVMV